MAVLLTGLIQASQAVDWYVATNGTGPGTNGWANATNSLQGAIDKSAASDTIWVSNGLYASGGITNSGYLLTNRVAITKAITVRSQNNDPANTIIKGKWDPATNGPSAVRCVSMAANSTLVGFTLTNGATYGATLPAASYDRRGGGVFCPDGTPVISNCIITGNSANEYGGGAHNGTLRNCLLTANYSPSGGGAYAGTLYNCLLTGNSAGGGGGGYGTVFYNCILSSNSATTGGGGNYRSDMYNCLLVGNSATATPGSGGGGGAAGGYRLYNCTLTGNSATYGGGERECALTNCIVYGNTAINQEPNDYYPISMTYSCTTPAKTGEGNITNDPLFVNSAGGNYRLSPRSPCINAGTNFSWATNSADARSKDLDGRQRVRYGVVDMGTYEHIRAGTIYGVR